MNEMRTRSIFVRSPYVPRAVPSDAAAKVKALQHIVASLPILDSRSPDEILGYDQDGVFG
jgi:hypothetical protein